MLPQSLVEESPVTASLVELSLTLPCQTAADFPIQQAMRLLSSDPGVDEHLFLCELLAHGTQHDPLNLPDLALGEAIPRRLGVSAGRATERHLFLGRARPKGNALVLHNRKNGLLHSSLSRQPSSRKEGKDVKTVNWWEPPLIQGARTIGKPT